MKVGFCRSAISPPIGIQLAGYASRTEPSKCIYDDLYVRCVTLQCGKRAFAIVVIDSIGIPYDLYQDVLNRCRSIEETYGIELGVVVGATHSHATPYLSMDTDEIYREYVVRSIIGCIQAALRSSRQIEKVVVGEGYLRQLVYNRRNPARGAVDPQLIVLDLGIVALINFTCHPVVLGPDNLCISSDYPGTVIRVFEKFTNKNAIYLNGCCGDVNPFTPTTRMDRPYDRRGATYEEVLWFGEVVALEAIKALRLGEALHLHNDMIDYRVRNIELKVRDLPRPEDIGKLIAEAEKRGDRYEVWRLKRLIRLSRELGPRRSIVVPIAALKIGKAIAMVFLPAEVFVEHQLYIKSKSPFKYTIVSCYFNCYWGYIPTREAFDEGGYEVELPVSIVKPGEGEKLRDEVLTLLQELYTYT